MSMIEKMTDALIDNGFTYNRNGDYGVIVDFPKYNIYIFETLSGKILVKAETIRGEKISSRTYKTVKGAIKYIIMTDFVAEDEEYEYDEY